METSSPPTSLTLLDRLRAPRPDHAAHTESAAAVLNAWNDGWARFKRLYEPLLRTWAKRQGFNDADADDLTQEILVRLMHALPQYQPRVGKRFRGWLFELSSNLGKDFRRRVATRALPGSDGLSQVGGEPPLAELEEAEYRKALVESGLNEIKGEFEERTWAAFEQVMVQHRPAADVAADLGMTKGAVYSAQSRVLARLREVIDAFLD